MVITVEDLIKHLQQFPPKTPCITRMCSDYEDLELPVLWLQGDMMVARRPTPLGCCRHDGDYMRWSPLYSKEDASKATFLTAVYFAGN